MVSILVVDDDEDILILVKKILGSSYNVIVANSALVALQALDENEIHVIITDIEMPEIDGITLAKKLQSCYSYIPLIFITGYGRKSSAIQAIKANAFDFIEKPFEAEDLLFSVARAEEVCTTRIERSAFHISLKTNAVDILKLNNQISNLSTDLVSSSNFSNIGQMTAGVTHEIKAPLIVAQVLLEKINNLSVKSDPSLDPIFEHSEVALSYINRIFKIIKGMEAFIGESENEPFIENSILEIVKNAVEIGEYKIKTHSTLKMTTENIANDLTVQARSVQLGQVIINLLNNAITATEDLDEQWIDISATTDEETVKIFVTNSGPLIPQDARDRIFDTSYTKKGKGGCGLGLSICLRILKEHNGSLKLDEHSEHTKFIVTLPKIQNNVM